ncbi:MAG: hypothetical protein C0599_06185 [Salinivirgaceae bacterium]|nr:MAG: hypothetical protein C0599_06185 [Salinivirgaceae bacterium]
MIKKLIPLLSVFFVFGCASPQDIIKVTSIEKNIDWLWGKQVVTKEINGLTVAVKFERTHKRFMVFDVEILNNKDSKITISPTDFKMKPIVDSGLYHYGMNALDPEDLLLALDKKISRNKAAQSNAEMTSLILNTAAATADIAMTMSKKDTPEKSRERDESRKELSYSTQSNINYKYAKGDQLQQQREYYATSLLRKTTLYKGESIRGYIYIPKNTEFNPFQLILNLAPGELRFNFKQESIPAYHNYSSEQPGSWYP